MVVVVPVVSHPAAVRVHSGSSQSVKVVVGRWITEHSTKQSETVVTESQSLGSPAAAKQPLPMQLFLGQRGPMHPHIPKQPVSLGLQLSKQGLPHGWPGLQVGPGAAAVTFTVGANPGGGGGGGPGGVGSGFPGYVV